MFGRGSWADSFYTPALAKTTVPFLPTALGNVRVVVSDVKRSTSACVGCAAVVGAAPFVADIRSYSNYYPFGMLDKARSWSGEGYRYGYNGKEKDDEVKGEGNSYDYGFRIYDPRVARFLSVDPLTKNYPMLTPYQFASNMPIWAIDLDGLEARIYTETKGTGHTFITVHSGKDLILYTYGRYASADWYTIGTTGDGVLVRYTGEQAISYLKTELYRMEAKAYEIKDVDPAKVEAFFEAKYNSSTQRPNSKNADINEYGRVIDTYSLFGANCTTISCDALKYAGTDIFEVETVLWNYDEDFTIPSSLNDFLFMKNGQEGSQVVSVTEQLKKDLANTGKKSTLKSAGVAGTSSGSSGDSSGSSANDESGGSSSSGNGSGSFGSGSGSSSSQDFDK